jgi:FixJ family two-component response regulator
MPLAPLVEPVVYIVNGDEPTRSWIEATVTSAGLRTHSFESAGGLRAVVRPNTVACAILEVTLPDGCGLELQIELARAGIPTLFLTRERCIASCVRAVRAGAVDYLTTPCNALSLVRALRDAVRLAIESRTQRVQVDELRSRYELLTARERQVFALMATGLRNKQIAHQLGISQITVQIHRGQVTRKMAARSFASLVRMADVLQPAELSVIPRQSKRARPESRTPCE